MNIYTDGSKNFGPPAPITGYILGFRLRRFLWCLKLTLTTIIRQAGHSLLRWLGGSVRYRDGFCVPTVYHQLVSLIFM